MSSSWEGRGRGHVEGRTWRPPPLSFVGIERVVLEVTTITSSGRSCWNGTRGRDEGKSGCQQGDTQECREERRDSSASRPRAREISP